MAQPTLVLILVFPKGLGSFRSPFKVEHQVHGGTTPGCLRGQHGVLGPPQLGLNFDLDDLGCAAFLL